MKENTVKQMTIDDYLNNGDVAVLDSEPIEKEEIETLEVTPVELESLTKADLISLIKDKDIVLSGYEHRVEELSESHKNEIENMNTYYTSKIKELTSLIKYYERKLNILKDIITIETGGEK